MVLNIKTRSEKSGTEILAADNYIYDTNIFIYHLNDDPKVRSYFNLNFLAKNQIYFSIITEIELLSFPKLTANDFEAISSLLKKFTKLNLTEEVKDKAIEIKKYSKSRLADSIIAASAISYNAKLITRNNEDFKNISELITVNPFK